MKNFQLFIYGNKELDGVLKQKEKHFTGKKRLQRKNYTKIF